MAPAAKSSCSKSGMGRPGAALVNSSVKWLSPSAGSAPARTSVARVPKISGFSPNWFSELLGSKLMTYTSAFEVWRRTVMITLPSATVRSEIVPLNVVPSAPPSGSSDSPA